MRADLNVTIGPWPDGSAPAWSADAVVDHADRFRLDAVLVRAGWSLHYDPAWGNARLLDEIAGRPRLLPAFVLGPLDSGEHGDPAALADSLRSKNVRGIWLCPARHAWSVRGAEAESLLAVLRHAGLPVFVELDDMGWADIDHVCQVAPELDVIVSGIGYRTIRQAIAVMRRHPRLHVDLAYLATFGGVALIAERFGAHRLVLATGAPGRDTAAPWLQLEHAGLSDADAALIAGGNAQRLLRHAVTAQRTGAAPQLPPADVVDFHAHIGRWPNSWIPHPDAADLVRASRTVGIGHSVISSLEAIWVDTTHGNADAISAVDTYPESLSAHLVINPHEHRDCDVLRDQLALPGVRGIKVHPDTHRCAIDDPRYEWVWELARDARAPVLGHGFAGSAESDPYRFGNVAERHPDLPLVVGHAGATVEGFVRTIEVGRRHLSVHAETCGSWMTGRWLAALVDALGPDRVLHGTDACLIDPAIGLGRALGAGLDDERLRAVLGGNARRLLRLGTLATTEPPNTKE